MPTLRLQELAPVPDGAVPVDSTTTIALIVLIISAVLIVLLIGGALIHRKFVRGRLPRRAFRP